MVMKNFGIIATVMSVIGLPTVGHCTTFQTLYQFKGGNDGANSYAELVIKDNKLYGTTFSGGGTRNAGTLFSLDITTGLESVLYSFIGPKDGGNPRGGLLLWKGVLFGTTEFGGPYGGGEAFKFDPANATFTSLHGFGGPDDAEAPEVSLIEYGGLLYGTSINGGDNDAGALFAIDPNTDLEYVCFSFEGATGFNPTGRLLERGGVLFGTTSFNYGTLFSLDLDTGIFKLLYSFNDLKPGKGPLTGVIADGHQLLGTTSQAGGGFKQNGNGTIFLFNAKTPQPRTLHVFRGPHHDGETPAGDLLLENGVVYGTTSAGGRYGKGTVFQLVLATKTETVLHDFTGGEDGGDPVAGLIYNQGILYGTTYSGGAKDPKKGALNYGTVFEVIP